MKKLNGKKIWTYGLRIAAGAVVYLCLIGLLALSECSNPESSIQSLGDAFWYSLVTLSTVGYGDMYPTTFVGRVIGVCFIFLSLGTLACIVSAAVNFFTGSMLPALRLRFLRNKPWFVFSDTNMESLTLAGDLEQTEPDGVFLFPGGEKDALIAERGYSAYSSTMARLTAGKRENCTLFYMRQSSEPYQDAVAALSLGFPVVCSSEHIPDHCPDGLTLYNRYDGCAQKYWSSHIPSMQEKTILLIGNGKYAQALLEWGLAVNVLAPGHQLSYHVFGDWEHFRRNHSRLDATLSIGGETPELDSLYFHGEAWNQDAALLRQADRIILCQDADAENLAVMGQLRRYFPVKGSIHIRSCTEIPGEVVFGTDTESYTADLVLRGRLTRMARTLHQIYVDSTGGSAPGWEKLNDFTRRSNIAAAEHMRIKIRMLLQDDTITEITSENCAAAFRRYQQTKEEMKDIYRRMEHLRWMRFHSLFNWQYAPVRNNEERKHNTMLPYEELSLEEQRKDDYSWELLGSVCEYLK